MRRVCGHGTRLLRPQSTVSSTKALRPVAHNPCPTGAGQALTWDTSEGVHHRSIQRWQLGMYMLWLVSSAATFARARVEGGCRNSARWKSRLRHVPSTVHVWPKLGRAPECGARLRT